MNQTTYQEQLQDLLTQADGAYRAGDLVSARQIWEAVLQIDSQNQPALAGLQLTQLVDGHWAQLDRTSAGDATLHAQLARVRELLESGLVEEAARQADELAAQHLENHDALALRLEVHKTLQRQPLLRRAIDQARVQIASGQNAKAVQSCQEALELEPGNREAELLLEQAERALKHTPSAGTAMSSMELDLDLTLAVKPSSAATSAARATARTMPNPVHSELPPISQKKIDDDAPSVRDLLDAASGIDTEEQDVSEWLQDDPFAARPEPDPTETEATSNSRSEAERLVLQAREALGGGDVDRATQLASRGMALWDGVPGASELMEQARGLAGQRAQQIEELMQEAISAFDQGRNDLVVPLLNQVLKLAPGHREAKEYLSRTTSAVDDEALQLMMKAASNPQALFEADLLNLDSKGSPAVPVATAPAPARAPSSPAPEKEAIPLGSPPNSSDRASEPPSRGASPVVARSSAPKGPSRGTGRLSGSLIKRVIAAVVGVALLVAGAWFLGAFDSLFGDRAESVVVERPAKKKTPATNSAAQAAASVASTAPAAAPATPAYGPKDVPDLRRRARAAREQSEFEQSVVLLQAARVADPTNFDVADELNAAQQLLQQQQANLARLKEAKETWKLQDYDEAMRLLYRLPKEMQPPSYTHWLANGWYNLGVLALQRGDVGEALQFFHDGLELNSGDKEMERHREIAKRYRGKRLDSTFSTYANGIALREMDD